VHPILLEIGTFRIFSYGVLIALGGVFSCRFWLSRRERMGIKKEDDFWLLVNAILFGGFLGGRALYLLEYTRLFSADFWDTLISFSKGFSVMGAFVGVTAALWWFSRRARAPFLTLLDYVCQAAPVWHAFGRLGCFMAGCCFGRPTDMPWGVTFRDPRSMVDAALLGHPIHPTQLYEAGGDLVLAALLYRFALRAVEQRRQPPGTVAVCYFIGYSLIRFIVEFYRGDTVAIGRFTAAQGFSVLFIVGAITTYFYSARRQAAST
jgi:phosphatidylglycerol:prolipoprotein diacylglycerol transferase